MAEIAGSAGVSTRVHAGHRRAAATLAIPPAVVAAVGLAPAAAAGALSAHLVVECLLVLVWSALVAALLAPGVDRVLEARVVAAGCILGAAGLAATAVVDARRGGATGDLAVVARAAATGLLPVAAFAALLVGAPARRGRRRTPLLAAVAIGIGVAVLLAAQQPDLPAWPVALEALGLGAWGLSLSAAGRWRVRGAVRRRLHWLWWSHLAAVTGVLGYESALVLTAHSPALDWVVALLTLPVPVTVALVAGRTPPVAAPALRVTLQTATVVTLADLLAAMTVAALGHRPTGDGPAVLALATTFAAATMVGVPPLSRRLAATLGRGLEGGRGPARTALGEFAVGLSRRVPLDELVVELAEALREGLELGGVAIWGWDGATLDPMTAIPGGGPDRATLSPEAAEVVARTRSGAAAWAAVWTPQVLSDAGGDVRVVPVAHLGRLLGLVVAWRRRHADPLADEEVDLLVAIARQLAAALNTLRLDTALQSSLDELRRQAEELRASRARVVAVADVERRRIERDLHDGAQQHLVSLAVRVRLARGLVERDPAGATLALDRLGVDLKDAIEELRRVAHGVYPPLLMDRGLPEALRAAAARVPLTVHVDAAVTRRRAEAVESAVYFSCLEALQNATKHAGTAATVAVELREGDDGLHFTVRDDGAGFDPAVVRGGAGFVNMGDRIGAVGGTLRITSAQGAGTELVGFVPDQV